MTGQEPPGRKLEVVQINLHHSTSASLDLIKYIADNEVDVALIQEPWLVKGRVKGLGMDGYRLYTPQTQGKVRTCIVARKNINIFPLTSYSNGDLTTVVCEHRRKPSLLLTSAYFPYNEEEPPPTLFRQLVAYAKSRGVNLVAGCDANGHHELWGSSDTNSRGESIFEFLLSINLTLCNKGNEPTFRNRVREEVIDLTLATDSNSFRVDNWRVSDTCSFSDHSRIRFSINSEKEISRPFRNPRKTDWSRFSKLANRRLASARIRVGQGDASTEKSVGRLTGILTDCFKLSCPLSRPRAKAKPVWWNAELGDLRLKTRRLYNKAKRSRLVEDWNNYRGSFNEYKSKIKAAKRDSWEQFCGTLENVNEASRLRKILSGTPTVLGSIEKPDDSWTNSSQESLEVLMKTHFPGCTDSNGAELVGANRVNASRTDVRYIVDDDKVAWAICSFDPYKSAGPDGIIPAMLQHSIDSVVPHLTNIFSRCLMDGYVPKAWREVRVVFIPKAGKLNHSNAKDYRPISLSSFLLKTLERLIDLYIREVTSIHTMDIAQHAYRKGRSVDSALHEVVGTIEKSLEFKEYTLAGFLDIEGAFNNVNTGAIRKSLIDHGVSDFIVAWISTMLESRVINAVMGTGSVSVRTTRGTPQGGVLSPLLWLLVVNEILGKFKARGTKVVAYADDVAILIPGKYLSTISELMESAIAEISEWAKQNGLGVNPAKTELVLFTRKTKIPSFPLPKLDGVALNLSTEAKYLGVVLDSKLTWRRNTEERTKKGLAAYFTCKRTFGKRWGLSPYIVHGMYITIIRPIITYGSLVWWKALDKKCNKTRIGKVQRLASLGISGAVRSAPQEGLNVIFHLLPLRLFIQGCAAKSALRLRECRTWKTANYGHCTILNEIKQWGSVKIGADLEAATDYMTPILDFRTRIPILYPTRESWESGCVSGSLGITIYTDGSKMENGTGAGLYSEALQKRESFRLPNTCSVFQAEIYAIEKAAALIQDSTIRPSNITICVDSQAALKAIESKTVKSKMVLKCRAALMNIEHHKVSICWVPGHSNIEGNEQADEMARRGSELDISEADTTIQSPMCELLRSIDVFTIAVTNELWTNRSDCEVTRTLWPGLDRNRTRVLLGFDKPAVRVLTGVLTGHCAIAPMLQRWRIPTNGLCRSCHDEEEVESIYHYLCLCPSLQMRRLHHLGSRFFTSLAEIARVDLTDLLAFVWKTKWFNKDGSGVVGGNRG